MNLATLPDLRAALSPDAPAVADDTTDFTNTQFFDAVRRASSAMREHDVSAGDLVAIMLPNQAEFVVALFAAWRLGAAVTPISPTLVAAEARYQIADAGAKVLVVDKPLEFGAPVHAVLTTAELASWAHRRRACTCQRRRPRPADLHQRHNGPPQGRHARPRQPECHVPHGDRRLLDDQRG